MPGPREHALPAGTPQEHLGTVHSPTKGENMPLGGGIAAPEQGEPRPVRGVASADPPGRCGGSRPPATAARRAGLRPSAQKLPALLGEPSARPIRASAAPRPAAARRPRPACLRVPAPELRIAPGLPAPETGLCAPPQTCNEQGKRMLRMLPGCKRVHVSLEQISLNLRLLSSPCTGWWQGQLVYGMTASPFDSCQKRWLVSGCCLN